MIKNVFFFKIHMKEHEIEIYEIMINEIFLQSHMKEHEIEMCENMLNEIFLQSHMKEQEIEIIYENMINEIINHREFLYIFLGIT